MKSILILSVELESASDIIAIVKCFLGKEELIADAKEVIEIIKSGDYSKRLRLS